MRQKFLQRNEIYQSIISELVKSEVEIMVVSAWFANEELFNILLEKQKQGVKVKLIIEDDTTNEKIRFSELIKAGGEIFKIEKDGLGMINTKYCIIDEKIAILTLFNWSANVLVNNSESVVITYEHKSIHKLKTGFYKMTIGATRIERKNIKNSLMVRFKKRILKYFGVKEKEPQSLEDFDLKNNGEREEANEFEPIKTNRSIEDELRSFFRYRN